MLSIIWCVLVEGWDGDDVEPDAVEEGAVLRSSSRRLLLGVVCDCDGVVACAHVVESIWKRAGMEPACLKSFIIQSVATILSAYCSGWHMRSRVMRYWILP